MNFDLSDAQVMLQKTVKSFSDAYIEPIADKIDHDGKLPDALIQKMAQLDLLGMAVPEKYGGTDVGELCCVLACEQMAYSGCGAWWLLAFNNSIPDTIAQFGSEAVKTKYLKPLCNGLAYASIQFTESDTGSEPKALVTRARRDKNDFVITGTKRFSTFGARDGYSMLFARGEDGNCSAYIVPKNVPGYKVSKTWDLMGSGGIETVDVYLEDVHIPMENLLGVEGKGFDVLMHWISVEKIQQCAACVGMAQAALDEALKYARSRSVRNRSMADMQGIRWMLAEMQAKSQAARWLTYRAAYLKDAKNSRWINEAATAKLMVVPTTIDVVELARRIHGAYGYTKEFKIERLYRAISGASAIAVSLEINRSIVGSDLLK